MINMMHFDIKKSIHIFILSMITPSNGNIIKDTGFSLSMASTGANGQQSNSDSCARVPLEVEEMHNVEIDDCYNKNQMPPTIDGKGIMVNISMNLNSLLSIDEPTQEISLESTIRLAWFDRRIKAKLNKSIEDYVIINRNPVDHFWFPDVFISKAKELRKPFYKIPPAYLRIHDDGKMIYSARVNFDLSCPMDFAKYPVDLQECNVTFESWGHTTKQLLFQWNADQLTVNPSVTEGLNQHSCQQEFINMTYGATTFSTGSFTSVILRLKLRRKLHYHLLRTYLPSGLFVMVAWFSMFVPLNHVPGRVAMSMTTLLTLASMFAGLVDVTPPISYTTKLDTWMITCIVFVFGTLAEFTVVIVLKYYLHNLPPIASVNNGGETKPNTPQTASTLEFNHGTITSIDRALERSYAWGGKDETVNRFLGQTINSAFKENKESLKERPRSKTKPGLKNQAKQVMVASKIKPKKKEEIIDDDASEDEEDIIEERRIMAERIIKRIEKYSVVVYFLIFILFNIWYWVDIITCLNSNYKKFEENEHLSAKNPHDNKHA